GVELDTATGVITIDKGAAQDESDVSAVAKDAGDNSSSSASVKAPDSTAPVITNVKLSEVSDSGINADDSLTNVKRGVIEGQTEAGATVVVTVTKDSGGTPISIRAVVDSSGKFTAQLPRELDDGSYTVRVTAVDDSRNATRLDDATKFTVDTKVSAPDLNQVGDIIAVDIPDADKVDAVELSVTYIDKSGNSHTITATKGESDWSYEGNLPEGGEFDPTTGGISIPITAIDPTKQVQATLKDKAGNQAVVDKKLVFAPYFDESAHTFEYFENTLRTDSLGSVLAKDLDGRVTNYYFVNGDGSYTSTSHDGKYSIDNSGKLSLTRAGGGLDNTAVSSTVNSNDFELLPNTFGIYRVVAKDDADQYSETIDLTFKVNNVLSIPHLWYNTLNETNGVNSSGDGFSTDKSNRTYQFTTENADKVLIGYTESGAVTTGLAQGQIENNAKLYTGGGDDYVKLSQSIGSNNMSGGVNLGDGNNTILIGNDIIGGGGSNVSTAVIGAGRSWLVSGSGDDTVVVGDFSWGLDRDDIQNATVVTGAGNDFLRLNGGIMSQYSIVDMGSGNDTILITDRTSDSWLAADQSLDGKKVNSGTGSTSGGSVKENSIIILGEGSDEITITGMLESAKIIGGKANAAGYNTENYALNMTAAADLADDGTDNGNDTVSIEGYLSSGKIDMGNGNNTVTITGEGVWYSSSINFGSGNDSLYVTKAFGKGAGQSVANMGKGDDTVTWNGYNSEGANPELDGKFNGGEGNDTLVVTSTTAPWNAEITHIHSKHFSGFENIQLKDRTVLDITYNTFGNDADRSGALYITGTSRNKVDLGGSDWNTDTDKNLGDWSNRSSGGSWAQIKSAKVGDITYDVYRHTGASSSDKDDVYIQQGIIVI
ncbi:Ig-like domain-containing protein, partial [Chelonobacter oris]|uniref:Ig-like domain-containing protein n=1 Tax=Chelonobacter oris TaxID=505317 RepID=UPI00244A5C08